MRTHSRQLFTSAIGCVAIVFVMLVMSYFIHGAKAALLVLTIGLIFFEITVPLEILKRLHIHPRDCNIYAHNIDTILDLFFPPFGRMRNKPDFDAIRQELQTLAITTIVVLLPYVLCFWAYYEITALSTDMRVVISWNFPPKLVYEIFTQIFVIALPEEIFYRGFVQSALLAKMPSRSKWHTTVAILLTNIIFALAHVVSTMNPVRFLTFFPGLVFSYLVVRHKSLLSAIVFHAICNILGQILYASFYLQ